jgi:hypothetical protein
MVLTGRRAWWLPRITAAGLLLAAACLSALASGPAGASTTAASSPGVNGAGDTLNGVDCLSTTSCIAVGSTNSGPLAQVWNGSTWTVTPTPPVAGTLYSISCTSFSNCVAVGSYISSPNVRSPLTEAWNGSSWQQLPAVGTTGYLISVSCPSSTVCVAVGAGPANGEDNHPVSALWNGTAWTVLDTPTAPSSLSSVLNGVSCADATDCTAVGWGEIDGGYESLAEDWSDGSWQIQPVPSTSTQHPPQLYSVSCPAASTCFAVGNGDGAPAVVQWNGSTWQEVGVGSPVPAATVLDTISCQSVSRCMAYGTAGDGSAEVPVGAQLSDGDWSMFGGIQNGPGGPTYPLAASCVNTSNCMVAGYYDPASGQQLRLSLLTDGTSWSVPAVPDGYQMLLNGGGVDAFHTESYGSQSGAVVGIAPYAPTGGYWVLYADGSVQSFDAPYYGSEAGSGETPVGIVPDTATGEGYWILNSNGGVNNYGAPWYGSQRGHLTSKPVGIASGPPGDPGYWILDANGGVSNYNEPWEGSERGHLTHSVVGIASYEHTTGYWILNSAGGVTGFNAPWRGSETGQLTHPVVAIAGSMPTGGYWILNSVGGVSGFGAPWYGSAAGTQLSGPPVGLIAP